MLELEKYTHIIEKFTQKLQNIKNYFENSETQDAFTDICSFMRIGRINVLYFSTLSNEKTGDAKEALLYNSENADTSKEREVCFREQMSNGSITHYLFSPIAGAPDWDDEEKGKLKFIENLIYVYASNSILIGNANKIIFTDMALDIYNNAFFMKKVGELLAKNEIDRYGAVYFNLRHFSSVNNKVGHNEGTIVMKKFAHGLKDKLSDKEYVCRLGGDHFLTLFLKEHLDIVFDYLKGTKIKSDNYHSEFLIRAYAGFYILDSETVKKPADVLQRTTIMLNMAKKNPENPFIFYNDEIHANLMKAHEIEDAVPEALRNGEFLVFYQPKVNTSDCSLIGAEALCRWKHDDKLIPPIAFIPILERSRLICELDFYMLDHVCRDIRRWLDEGKEAVRVSVNFSRVHLGDPNLLRDIISIIDKHSVPHKYIEIELTETTTEVDYSELKKLVAGLRDIDISTAVDDFGIGYSSLNLIRELPWNVLKIDKCFLPESKENEHQKHTMLKHVISMAQELGLECIVEGVETIEQVELLKEHRCFLAQGYYFDKPLPVEVFEKKLTQKQ